ncbi:MAG: ATP-dependent DNA helicase RecG [Oscillospiraceae bacterium]|jgi:ATP-dependent DNA helicase RecG|nr:ATP-dependent DNA helicase RecG [Oscillospiraceae bacterium]
MTWNDVKGVGPARLQALEQAGLFAPEDLAERLPIGYRDTARVTPIAALRPGTACAFEGVVARQARPVRAAGKFYVTTAIQDSSGLLRCTWFSAPWMAKNLPTGAKMRFYGHITRQANGQLLAINPSIVDEIGILPVYRPIEKLPPKTMRGLIAATLDAGRFDDPLPETFRNRYGLCPRQFALRQAHFPQSEEALLDARHRLAFEELTLFQMHLQGMRARGTEGIVIPSDAADAQTFWSAMPFRPTGAQARVLDEIRADLAAKEPMARLVQGDVGCGKTAIAFGALYLAAKAGYQGALMAPTEVLAAQHFRTAQKLLEPLGVRCLLLTGQMPAAKRRAAREAAMDGSAQVVIGTHALISQGMGFARLGLAITDEQHRFGVRQRSRLADTAQSVSPNVLVLSATPIPRTLSLILFGDLDVSIVDELPPGRTPVKSRIVPESKREGLYGFLRAQASQGRQAYIVCPLVEDSEMADAVSAESLYETLRTGALSTLRVGLAHGRQRADEKDEVLRRFAAGEIDVLIATTVVEVGVDVPSASVMVIENADRFGLSQLHQLRGRVGRGAAESYCFLMAESNERLEALLSTTDGFVIAQKDLEQRGPGEWFGTRQHGAPAMPGAALGGDVQLLEQTQRAVKALLADPARAHEAEMMRAAASARFGGSLEGIGLN